MCFTADLVDRTQVAVKRIGIKDQMANIHHDIFYVNESDLVYHSPPSKTLRTVKRNKKKSQKDIITVAKCCNMNITEKMDLVVIGKS